LVISASIHVVKIYTRSGDAGETALFGGGRVRKDHERIEAMGTVDELNAMLGVARTELARGGTAPGGLDDLLSRLQHELFHLGAELATPQPDEMGTDLLGDGHVSMLEADIDSFDAELEPLRAFILPAGCPAAAQLHLARCVCRRAERRLVELSAGATVRGVVLRYLNRLSDLLFVLARAVNRANRVPDVTWQQETMNRQ
jgi:cob(I)alamin adenosyltransferase